MTTMIAHVPRDPSLSFLGQLPRLTHHEEATLLRQVARARLEQSTAHPDALVLEAGQRARSTLIAAGQRLVIYLAKRFLARCHSMTLSDLIGEGTLGLIQAIDSYASIQGYAYSTWVELKIKDAIRTALYQRDRLIRLPAKLVDASRRLQRLEPHLALTLGRTPTSGELAQAMQVQEHNLASLLCLADYTPCSLHTPPEDCRPLGYEEIGRRLALNPGHACLIEQRALRLALTYYTPAQAAARLGVRVQRLNRLVKRGKLTRQIVPPNTRRAHYLREEVDTLAAQGEPLAHESLEAAYARLVAQGQQVSLAGLCQRTQLSGRVAGPFLRERQQGLVAVARQA